MTEADEADILVEFIQAALDAFNAGLRVCWAPLPQQISPELRLMVLTVEDAADLVTERLTNYATQPVEVIDWMSRPTLARKLHKRDHWVYEVIWSLIPEPGDFPGPQNWRLRRGRHQAGDSEGVTGFLLGSQMTSVVLHKLHPGFSGQNQQGLL
jgi:hypothetical protein